MIFLKKLLLTGLLLTDITIGMNAGQRSSSVGRRLGKPPHNIAARIPNSLERLSIEKIKTRITETLEQISIDEVTQLIPNENYNSFNAIISLVASTSACPDIVQGIIAAANSKANDPKRKEKIDKFIKASNKQDKPEYKQFNLGLLSTAQIALFLATSSEFSFFGKIIITVTHIRKDRNALSENDLNHELKMANNFIHDAISHLPPDRSAMIYKKIKILEASIKKAKKDDNIYR